jgi:hypothetical protein
MSNVSIEPRMADAALMLPSVEAGRNELKKKHEGRIILVAWILGSVFGASLKLLAYERLLQDYPTWQSKVRSSVSFFQLPRNGRAVTFARSVPWSSASWTRPAVAGLQGIFGYELAHQRLALVEGQ